MSDHSTHDELFDELLANAEDPRAALDGSSLASCAQCGALLAEHLALAAELDELGEDEREALGTTTSPGATSSPAAPLGRAEDRLRDLIRRDTWSEAGRGPRAAPRLAPRIAWWLAAAAVLLVAFAWYRRGRAPAQQDPGGALLGSSIELLEPVGIVDDFAEFRWTSPLPRRGWFTVLVYDATPGAPDAKGAPDTSGVAIAESPQLTEPRWTPDEDTGAWPARIRWHLKVFRGTGGSDVADSDFTFAERSSR